MSTNLNSLFATRRNTDEIRAQLDELNKRGGGFETLDLKEWKLPVDKAGNGSAVIRFLMSNEPSGLAFVKLINHGAKVNNKWYIENCPTTHGAVAENYEACPVCSYMTKHDVYNTDKELYKALKRSTSFYAKILVINDIANPSNNGQVFIYRFGTKIMAKINGMINVNKALGEVPVDVTCPQMGANFVLKAQQVSGQRSYDSSTFQAPGPIPGLTNADGTLNEEFSQDLFDQMEAIHLDAIVAPDQFKTTEQLTQRFDRFMGQSTQAANNKQLSDFEKDLEEYETKAEDPYTEDVPLGVSAPKETGAQAVAGSSVVDDLLAELDLDDK